VHEAEAAGSVPNFGDQLRTHAFVDGVEEAIFRQVAERFEDLDIELATDDRGEAECPITRFAQAREPPADDLLDPFGQAEGRRALAASGPLLKRGERAGFREMSEHFADEERIALGAVRHEAGEGRRDVPANERVDEYLYLIWLEAAKHQPRDRRLTPQVGQHLGQRMCARQFALTVRADDAERGRGGRAHDVPQHQQRGLVGPMQIVEYEHHRAHAGHLGQQIGDGFEQPVSLAFWIHRRLHGEMWHPAQQLRYQGAELGAAADGGQLRAQVALRAHVCVPGQCFDKRLVRHECFLVTSSSENRRRRFGTHAREFQSEPGLANSRLASE
jgi:hypothetical protein